MTAVLPGGSGSGSSLPAPWTADDVTGEVTAAAEPGKTPLTVEQSDKLTPAMILQPAAGATLESDSVLVMNDDTGTAICDWDASGTLTLGYGGFGISAAPEGKLDVIGDPDRIPDGSAIFRASTPGGGVFSVVPHGRGRTFTVAAGAEGDRVIDISSDESTADGADMIFANGAPDYNGGEFRVTAGGAIVTGQTVAPSNSNLSANQCAIWFDSTNGAAKIMFKGKTANGTVVSGQVALS